MDEGKQRKMDKIREWGKAALFILVMIPVGLAILACALAARAFCEVLAWKQRKKDSADRLPEEVPPHYNDRRSERSLGMQRIPGAGKARGKGGSL